MNTVPSHCQVFHCQFDTNLEGRNLNWGAAPSNCPEVMSLRHFLDQWLIGEGPTHCGQCHPEQVVLGCMRKGDEQAMSPKSVAAFLRGPCLCSCLSPSLTSLLKDCDFPVQGLWSGHISQINPLLKLCSVMVFITCKQWHSESKITQCKSPSDYKLCG